MTLIMTRRVMSAKRRREGILKGKEEEEEEEGERIRRVVEKM